jgi:hypothetical protein
MSLFPFSLLPMLLLPRLQTVMTKFSFDVSQTVLLWFCVIVRFLSRAPMFLASPPPLLLFALNLPCRLAAVADDALLGMVTSDLLLLLSPASSSTCSCDVL